MSGEVSGRAADGSDARRPASEHLKELHGRDDEAELPLELKASGVGADGLHRQALARGLGP
jgi:hypothetical protein